MIPSVFHSVSFMPLFEIYSANQIHSDGSFQDVYEKKSISLPSFFVLPHHLSSYLNQYFVYKSQSKNEYQRFELSPQKAGINDIKKDYYLTWTSSGSFFVLFPQIGNEIYLFNEKGEFLWKLKESRYLQLFNDENWIMAVSGDHSRVGFLNYSFQEQIAHEGFLLHSYELGSKGQYCLGFLGGSLYIGDLNRKIYNYIETKKVLKKVSCDFKSKILLTYSFDKEEKHDILEIYKWDKEMNEKEITEVISFSIFDIKERISKKYDIPLKEEFKKLDRNTYPYSIPMKWNKDYGIALIDLDINQKSYRALLIFDHNKIRDVISMNAFTKENMDYSSWVIQNFEDKFILYSDEVSLFINKHGIFSFLKEKKVYAWQSKKSIASGFFQISDDKKLYADYLLYQFKTDE